VERKCSGIEMRRRKDKGTTEATSREGGKEEVEIGLKGRGRG